MTGLVGFALTTQAALAGAIDPTATLILMPLTRSLLFGLGFGAVPVAALSYIAATTPDERLRTRGVGQVGAVQGVAVALGPGLAGLLGVVGLLGPVWATPAIVAGGLIVVAGLLRQDRTGHVKPDTGATARVRPLRPWGPRLRPVLAAGMSLYLSLGLVLIVLGFVIQDRLGLDADETVRATAAASFVAGVVLIVMQGGVVPRLRWTAGRLLRVGTPIAALATAGLRFADQLWTIVAALAVLAVGMGLAIPGFTTAPTLLVGPDEQGSVAGLVQAVTGATFVLAPIGGTSLYAVAPDAPIVAALFTCIVATVCAWVLRAVPPSAPPAASAPADR